MSAFGADCASVDAIAPKGRTKTKNCEPKILSANYYHLLAWVVVGSSLLEYFQHQYFTYNLVLIKLSVVPSYKNCSYSLV